MDIHRNSTAVIGDGHRLVRVYRDRDVGAMTRQGLVNRVVQHLEHHVMESGAVIGVTDVHSGAFANRVEPF